MSLQIFFLICSNFSDILSIFSKVLGFYSSLDSVYIVVKVVYDTLNCGSFILTAYSAAGVYEKEKKLRKREKDISFTLRCLDDIKENGKLLLKFITPKEKFICTASEIFTSTKSVLLAAASVFISFNLLLLQLDREE
ncbi:hypothetical protein AVEN_144277-1 [Araneus ventricosus]|uniref:Uncharacterized protein n=1 Tax=Araneus ventricosus TaxID=182803 RepID=A0A4Y2HA45_ARAVE|nr:hypothetical protein AVEN_144277-1 [Araneus ventricosus]